MNERSERPPAERGSAAWARVLIVDDHPLVVEGLRAVLNQRAGFDVVGDAGDSDAALEIFGRLRPDVSIVDLRLPGPGGVAAIQGMRRIEPRAAILVLTSFVHGAEVKRALDAGATGFLLKGATGDQVVEGLRHVLAGRRFIAPEAVDSLLACPPGPPMGRRELEVLELVAQGLRNQEIADRLGLALGTVKLYVTRAFDTLGAKDRTEAVTLALKQGIIRLS